VEFWPSTTAGLALFGSSDLGRAEFIGLALLSLSQILVTGLLLVAANRWHRLKVVRDNASWVIVPVAAIGVIQFVLVFNSPTNGYLVLGAITGLVATIGTLAAFPDCIPVSVSGIRPALRTDASPDVDNERERHRLELAAVQSGHASELASMTQRFEPALLKSQIFVSTQDKDLHYIWVINPPAGLDVAAMIGKTDDDVMPRAAATQLTALKQSAMTDDRNKHAEVKYQTESGARWYDVSVEVAKDQSQNTTGVTTVAVNVTERKRLEQRLTRLTRDVTHRTKNVLAVVHAVARQTAARNANDFLESFGNRVQSLARTHDLLVTQDWQGVDLLALIKIQLSDNASSLLKRVSLTGPEVTVGAEATQNIGLAIHELIDNAKKHGAISGDTGTISIDWHLTGVNGDNDRALRIRWLEQGMSGSDAKMQPKRMSGFGHAFLETAVGRTLAGRAKLEMLPDGLCYDIEIPAYHLQPAG
jgi:two-component sensor histidine kinase